MPAFSNISRRVPGFLKSRGTLSSTENQNSSNLTVHGSNNDIGLNNHVQLLLSPEKLHIHPKHWKMFGDINMAVMQYMSSSTFDLSHDYEHVERVVMLAHKIYEQHRDDHWARDVDKTVLYIACMVHEIGDPKSSIHEKDDEHDQEDIIRVFLKTNGCKDPRIYSGAAFVAVRVKFSCELEDPEQIKADCNNYPALRIVQDAVRLDGLGAIGIGRCLVSEVVDKERKHEAEQSGIELHYDSFHKYLELMKTEKGSDMAKERLDFMDKFRKHWFEETDCSAVL
jgi:uncharacterized protein